MEVVHAERNIVQLIDVGQEDDVLDRVFHDFRVFHCRVSTCSSVANACLLALELEKDTECSFVVGW